MEGLKKVVVLMQGIRWESGGNTPTDGGSRGLEAELQQLVVYLFISFFFLQK